MLPTTTTTPVAEKSHDESQVLSALGSKQALGAADFLSRCSSVLLGLFLASLSAVSATGFQWPRRRRRGLSKMHLLFDCASKPGKEAGHFFMTRHRGYLLDIRYWYTLLASQRQQGFCYCSTHRYRNIGGRFSASLLEKYKNSSACQLPRGFPHWKIEGFPDTATG